MTCQTPYSMFDAGGSPVFRKRAAERCWFCFSFEASLQESATVASSLQVNISHPTEETPDLKAVNDSQEMPIPNPVAWRTETGGTIPANHGLRVMFEAGTPGESYDVELVVRLSDNQIIAKLFRMQIDPLTGDC